MHEMSLAAGLIGIINDEMAKHKAKRLLSARVCYGALSHVEPQSMLFAFEHMSLGTPLAGAKLELVELPLQLRCISCDHTFSATRSSGFFQSCPNCEALVGTQVDKGRELFLDHLEME